MNRRFIAVLLILFLFVGMLPLAAWAEEDILAEVVEEALVDENEFAEILLDGEAQPLFLNFGDSVANGNLENYPAGYGTDIPRGYYELFSNYLGANCVNYARRGMQTTDILYMIDPEFQKAWDNGKIHPDSWWRIEYPPFDKTPLEEVRQNLANADYISLCIGNCDYASFPGDVKSRAEELLTDPVEARALLEQYLAEGKIDREGFNALLAVMKYETDSAAILVEYVLDVLEGMGDYLKYFPQIVADFRAYNKDATIVLVGNFIPPSMLSFLQSVKGADKLLPLIYGLLDNMNLVEKEAAVKYNCLYVQTMGVDADWHPTLTGYQQIADRMISVLKGDPTYSGAPKLSTGTAKVLAGSLASKLGIFKLVSLTKTTTVVTKLVDTFHSLLRSVIKVKPNY